MAKATLAVQVLIVLLLVWIGTRLAPRRGPDPTASTLQRELEVLRTELVAALADASLSHGREPRRAAASVHEPGPSGVPERTEVGLSAEERLVAAATALERAAARLGGTPAVPSPHVVPAASDRGALSELHARLGADGDAVTRSYLFWPLADVLQRFGRPDDAYSRQSGGLNLQYRVGEEGDITFILHDGFVLKVVK